MAPGEGTGSNNKRADLECSECRKRFSKPEHLARHVRVHSGAKPYACGVPGCVKRFNRMDSRARHAKVHMSETTAMEAPVSRPPPAPEATIPTTAEWMAATTATWTERESQQQHRSPTLPSPHTNSDTADVFHITSPRDDPDRSYRDAEVPAWASGSNIIDQDIDLFALLTSGNDFDMHLDMPAADMPIPLSGSTSNTAGATTEVEPVNSNEASSHAQAGPDPVRHAVKSLSSLVHDFSVDISSNVEATGVTPAFLDACLACFFQHFHPVFPAVHEPTFALRDCAPTVLLTMIALGSLFLAVDGAVAKGEALWKIAHAAVATSWQSLLAYANSISATGSRLPTTPKQLALTSLLGQAYAVLSTNPDVQLTSQALRGLGFYLARHADPPILTEQPHCHEPSSSWQHDLSCDLSVKWKLWADQEVQRRAVLSHYILDGLVSHAFGLPNTMRHTINNLTSPCSDDAFEAKTAADWSRIMSREVQNSEQTSFRELLLHLFAFQQSPADVAWSHMSIPVVLEALQSLVTESRQAGGPSIGIPTSADISHALWRLFDAQISHPQQPTLNWIDLSIRWHTICIGLFADPNDLLQCLSRRDKATTAAPHLDQNSTLTHGNLPILADWQRSHLARRSLLHAIAIVSLVQKLPLASLNALHIPLACSVAGIILLASDTSGQNKMILPDPVCWKAVSDLESILSTESSPTAHYIQHGGTMPNIATSPPKVYNLVVAINTLHLIRQSRLSTWGLFTMQERLDRLLLARMQSSQ